MNVISEATTEEVLLLKVGPCELWCTSSPEAHADAHLEHRDCTWDIRNVPLTRHDPAKMCDPAWWRDSIEVYLRQHTDGGRPEVRMCWERASP